MQHFAQSVSSSVYGCLDIMCNNPLWLPVGRVQQKLCPCALRLNCEGSLHIFCMSLAVEVSSHLLRNSYEPNFTVLQENERKHISHHQQFQAQITEDVRPIHQELHPKTNVIAFNLHGPDHKYIHTCGQNNVIYIHFPHTWWPEQVHRGFALVNSAAGSSTDEQLLNSIMLIFIPVLNNLGSHIFHYSASDCGLYFSVFTRHLWHCMKISFTLTLKNVDN